MSSPEQMKTQEYLKNNSLLALKKEHGVNFRFSDCGRKVSLSYDQIESKNSDLIACECRGLILRRADKVEFSEEEIIGETIVLARPMSRFFNYGQPEAANIDWNSACAQEKLDGSLCIVHYDDIQKCWHMATRSVPEANLMLDGISGLTFRTLFEKALSETHGLTFAEFSNNLEKNKTYCFELVSLFNQIVVRYEKPELILLAIRDNLTGQEFAPKSFGNIRCAESFSLRTINDIISFVNSRNPMEHEGVVVIDKFFNRIKVKNAAYCAFNRCRDSLCNSKRNCLEIILQGKADDVISFLPAEISSELNKINVGLKKLIAQTNEAYINCINEVPVLAANHPDWNEQKCFAISVQSRKCWKAPLFEIKSGKSKNLNDFISKNQKNGEFSSSFLDMILNEMKII